MVSNSAQSTRPLAIAAANLVVGNDDFLAERQRLAIVNSARQSAGNPDLPMEMHKASSLSRPELIELLSPSLFAEDRIIVISGIAETGKDTVALLEDAIKNPADGVVLILMHSGKGRNKKLVSSWPKLGVKVFSAAELRPREKRGFVEQEFRAQGVRVSPEVIDLLMEGVGSDLRELASAVSQLITDTDAHVTPAAVRQYYQGQAEVSGFDIADYAMNGRKTEAIAATRRALQLGVPQVLISSALANSMRDIAKVAGAGRIDSRRDAGRFGMPPWKLDKTIRLARQWSPAAVSRGVQLVAELDAGVKGMDESPEYSIENTVRMLSSLARS